jgi:hypothetical protein
LHLNDFYFLKINFLYFFFFFCMLTVPEYEVVPVHAVSKRSSGSEDEGGHSLVAHLEAFGRPLQLALQRTTSLSAAGPPSALRMWAAERGGSAPDGVHLTEIPQVCDQIINTLTTSIILCGSNQGYIFISGGAWGRHRTHISR